MNRLWVKLTLAFLAISLAAIGVVAVVAQRATGEQFRRYVVASGMMSQSAWAETLTDYYAAQRWLGWRRRSAGAARSGRQHGDGARPGRCGRRWAKPRGG